MNHDIIEQVGKALAKANSVLVITGAGISVPSGVPAYRGPGGLYTLHPELQELLTAEMWNSDPNAIWSELNQRRTEILGVKPNKAHKILARWDRKKTFGRFWLCTQNIDGLHPLSGSQRLSEIHGNIWQLIRMRGEWAEVDQEFGEDAADYLEDALASEALIEKWSKDLGGAIFSDRAVPWNIPPCEQDNVRPNVVLFGEPYGNRLLATAHFIKKGVDMVLVVGCSGGVAIVANLVADALAANGKCLVVQVNPHEGTDLPGIHIRTTAIEALESLDKQMRT